MLWRSIKALLVKIRVKHELKDIVVTGEQIHFE